MVKIIDFINGATEITCEEAQRLYEDLHIATIINDGKDVSFVLEGEDEWSEIKRNILFQARR